MSFMKRRVSSFLSVVFITTFVSFAPFVSLVSAQGTTADYERANGLRAKYEALAVSVPGPANWIERTHRFWYRRTIRDGSEFIVYDADTKGKRPAFDHQKLADALSTAAGKKYTASKLPFNTIAFADDEK